MKRRGFVASLLAAPAALLTLPRRTPPFTITKPKRIAFGYHEAATVEHHDLAAALGMPTREVWNAKYEFQLGGWGSHIHHNYLQIVRTPIGWAGRRPMTDKDWEAEKQWALRQHVRTVHHILQKGTRHKVSADTTGDLTYTGGREFFGRQDTGRCTYLRNRGLVWKQWGEGDAMRGEWLSDIGWAV